MKLRIKFLGYEIASVTLDFDENGAKDQSYPPVIRPTPLTQGIKKMSTWWVSRGMS
jgi:hypothetical protein